MNTGNISHQVSRTIVGIGLVTLLSGAPIAQADFIQNSFGLADPHTTITFDEHIFPSWTVITNQYSDLGVNFFPFAIYDPYAGMGNVSNFRPNQSPLMGGQQIQFTTPQTEAAFTFQSYDGAVGTFQALLNGLVVETAFAPIGNFSLPNDFYGFSNITFDAISVSTNAWPAWIIDDIQLSAPIPIPATIWLFGSALVGLVGFGRRKQAR